MRFFRVRLRRVIACSVLGILVFLMDEISAHADTQKNALSSISLVSEPKKEAPLKKESVIKAEKKNSDSLRISLRYKAVAKAGQRSTAPASNCVYEPYVADDTKTAVNTSTKTVFENGVEVLKKRTVAEDDPLRKFGNYVADTYENIAKDGTAKETIREYSSSGKWSIRTCINPDGSETVDILPVGAIDPYVLVAQAIETIAVQPPPVKINDTGLGAQITQRGTVLWVDETYWNRPRNETVSAGPISVTVTLTPRSTTWNMGDGRIHYCGLNDPWNNDFSREPEQYACHHVYETATSKNEPYSIEATTNFAVSAVTNTGQILPVPDLQVTGTTETQVDEIQALVVPTPGQYGE